MPFDLICRPSNALFLLNCLVYIRIIYIYISDSPFLQAKNVVFPGHGWSGKDGASPSRAGDGRRRGWGRAELRRRGSGGRTAPSPVGEGRTVAGRGWSGRTALLSLVRAAHRGRNAAAPPLSGGGTAPPHRWTGRAVPHGAAARPGGGWRRRAAGEDRGHRRGRSADGGGERAGWRPGGGWVGEGTRVWSNIYRARESGPGGLVGRWSGLVGLVEPGQLYLVRAYIYIYRSNRIKKPDRPAQPDHPPCPRGPLAGPTGPLLGPYILVPNPNATFPPHHSPPAAAAPLPHQLPWRGPAPTDGRRRGPTLLKPRRHGGPASPSRAAALPRPPPPATTRPRPPRPVSSSGGPDQGGGQVDR